MKKVELLEKLAKLEQLKREVLQFNRQYIHNNLKLLGGSKLD